MVLGAILVSGAFTAHTTTPSVHELLCVRPARRQSATTAAGCGRWVIPSLSVVRTS